MKAILFRARAAVKRIPEDDSSKYAAASSFIFLAKLVIDIYLEHKRNMP